MIIRLATCASTLNAMKRGVRFVTQSGAFASPSTPRQVELAAKATTTKRTAKAVATRKHQMTESRVPKAACAWILFLLALSSSACATVPQYRRGHLADPTMPGNESRLEKQADRKFHVTREAAAGGDGETAGGGCGCGN